MATDRRAYDTATSAQVQSDLGGIISRLEATIDARSADVTAAMADFTADGVSAEYHEVEMRWNRAAGEVRAIIDLVRTTMVRNDETATTAQTQARNAVQSIG
jgi:hypothetical protein